MAKNKTFHILTEDLDTIKCVSPGIFKTLSYFFAITGVEDKRFLVGYNTCRLRFYCLHHKNRRKYLSLIHSIHVMACDMYKRDLFSDYMIFDCLLTHLISIL